MSSKEYRRQNALKERARARKWQLTHPERYRQKLRAWKEKNRALVNAKNRVWGCANKAKLAAKQSLYRAQQIKATPAWANTFFISEIYELAALRTKMLGVKHHVDHIVPLRSKLVCGLHV